MVTKRTVNNDPMRPVWIVRAFMAGLSIADTAIVFGVTEAYVEELLRENLR